MPSLPIRDNVCSFLAVASEVWERSATSLQWQENWEGRPWSVHTQEWMVGLGTE